MQPRTEPQAQRRRPTVIQDHLRQARAWIERHRELFLIGLILIVAGLAHAVNMFSFPFYETDEGTYMGQAWAATQGELSHYTYWYDHAPWGWFQIAGWTQMSGGLYTFGSSVNSGRVFMLLIQLGTVLLLYLTARALTRSMLIATIVSLVFALSPYGIYYHRRVLLDNIATFWVMLALYLLVGGRLTLTRVWLSAAALGVAVMSKEVAIFFLPVMAYLVYYRADASQKLFATVGWLALSASIISSYILLALLKLELFPQGTMFGADYDHVSLIGSLQTQMARGGDGGLFDPNSGFWEMTIDHWVNAEPFLVIAGTASALLGVLLIRSRRMMGILGLLTFSFWAFLARGGVVIEFYLVPLLPLFALNIGMALQLLFEYLGRLSQTPWPRLGTTVSRTTQTAAIVACLVMVVPGYHSPALAFDRNSLTLWQNEQVRAQDMATRWVMLNAPEDGGIVMDAYMWVELHDPPNLEFLPEDVNWPRSHWYWRVDPDPEISEGVFRENWNTIDYIVTTRQMRADLVQEAQTLPMVRTAMDRSSVIAAYDTGGYIVDIRRVHKLQSFAATENPILQRTWVSYKDRFVFDGRAIDPQRDDETTSEGQAYTMQRAVYMNDRQTFDEVWAWTQEHLQIRDDNLLAWLWGPIGDNAGYGVLDPSSAADADQDVALALLFAAKQWNEPRYQEEAVELLDSIWEEETVEAAGQRYLVAGPWATGTASGTVDEPVINPSYLAPYAYRIFAEADPDHEWESLVDSSYNLLLDIANYPELGGAAGLIPDWLVIDSETGELMPAEQMAQRGDVSSFDAIRINWRMAVDWIWNKDNRAREVIDVFHLPGDQAREQGEVAPSYLLDGTPNADYQSVSTYAGVLGALLFSEDQELVHQIYSEKVFQDYEGLDPDTAYWGDGDSYYDQNWAWFATLLMDGGMTNLWAGETVVQWDQVLPERY